MRSRAARGKLICRKLRPARSPRNPVNLGTQNSRPRRRSQLSKLSSAANQRERPMVDYRVLPTGDTAVVVEFGESITRQVNVIVLALDECLGSERHEGILETVPTFRGLNVIGRSPVAMWQPDDGASLKPGDKVIFPTRIPRHGRSARS